MSNRHRNMVRAAAGPYTRVTLADGTDATPYEDLDGNIRSATGKILEPRSARGIRQFRGNDGTYKRDS